jgi:DNA-binding LytR/AlgR family response regulator
VIFTTAYTEFAIESYEHNAIDYLLKPFSFDRFLKAIDKALKIIRAAENPAIQVQKSAGLSPDDSNELMFVKSEGKLIKIDLKQLWLVEGLKDYVQLWIDGGKIIIHTTMKNMEDQLANHAHFTRVHKSYIVNLRFITEVWGNSIKIKNQEITIGSTYRDEVDRKLGGYKFL